MVQTGLLSSYLLLLLVWDDLFPYLGFLSWSVRWMSKNLHHHKVPHKVSYDDSFYEISTLSLFILTDSMMVLSERR